jgi:hypothetical protein
MIKVRFHLGKGKNYMKWQVDNGSSKKYYDPYETVLVMKGCTLKNRRGTAEKIFAGQNKKVCAWVMCYEVEIAETVVAMPHDKLTKVSFNPRVAPHWVVDGVNADGFMFGEIVSIGRSLYL